MAPWSEGLRKPLVTVTQNSWSVAFKKNRWMWWSKPLLPALGRQRQMDLCEFEASLVYIEPVKATQRDPVEKERREHSGSPSLKSFKS